MQSQPSWLCNAEGLDSAIAYLTLQSPHTHMSRCRPTAASDAVLLNLLHVTQAGYPPFFTKDQSPVFNFHSPQGPRAINIRLSHALCAGRILATGFLLKKQEYL